MPGVYAQQPSVLPAPSSRLELSPAFTPALLKGIKIFRDDPFRFDFIIDKGEALQSDEQVKTNANRLIKYFLAALTVPEKDLWVNLSPYEKDRIVPEAFGRTEMGRDLLAQDYILKQITASVIYPEGEAGKQFWAKVYAEAQKKFGTTDIPVDAFNKVWIVPEKATVCVRKSAAFVVEGKLKVMLESDYAAMTNNELSNGNVIEGAVPPGPQELVKNILREIVIPILEKEVNEGQNFSQLRQVYNALILATWYKRKVKASLLGQAYVDQKKIGGIGIADKTEKEKIWQRYVEAFKQGAGSLINEEYDPAQQAVVARKYFTGGASMLITPVFKETNGNIPSQPDGVLQREMVFNVQMDMAMKSSLPQIDIPSDQLKVNRFSIYDSLAYHTVFSSWERNVFKSQLTVSNHFIIIAASVFLGLGTLAVNAYFKPAGNTVPVILSMTIAFITGHLMSFRDAYKVYRNNLEYAKRPDELEADRNLMDVVNKFVKATGWRVLWTDEPFLLADADREKKQVILSIGWVVESRDPLDRRRLASLTDVLRSVRHAIETEDKAMSIEKAASLVNKGDMKGGIDLDPSRLELKTKDSGQAVIFNVDPAMLQKMRQAAGISPVIIGVQPLTSLAEFLGAPGS